MEVLLECFFEQVFTEMERGCLAVRYKRKMVVDQLNTIIKGSIQGKICDPQTAVRNAVMAAVRYHEKYREENCSVGSFGKYHNILYVALKLSFDWQLRDSDTIGCLLDNIYQCEKTFERILLGAIFGTKAPYFITGWKSDFHDREENIRAMFFCFDHASVARLHYPSADKIEAVRFIDVPIESCGGMPPAKVVIHYGAPDMLHIFLRFGAIISEDAKTSGLEELLIKLKESKRVYPINLEACLKILLRVVRSVRVCPEDENYISGSNMQRDCFMKKYSNFVEDNLVPESRCGIKPPELKHLCRCAVRYRLWENYQLPKAIHTLPIPESLQEYLDLMFD